MSGVVVITLIVTFYCFYKRRRHARLHPTASPYRAEKSLLGTNPLDGRVESSSWRSENRSLDVVAHHAQGYSSNEPVEAGWMSRRGR